MNRVEVGSVYGACFIYHPEGCSRCSGYLEHLLEDISQRPARFSFSKDEILDGINEAWPHITEYIQDLDVLRATLEKELDIEKADNCQLRSEMDDLDEKIQELEAHILSIQPKTHTGDHSVTVASNTDISSSDVGSHPLNPSFQNRVRVLKQRPEHWLLYMWNIVKDWHTNPMSILNALRDDRDSYFLEEDAVFGSCDNFDTAFSGFSPNLLQADHEATMWITDSSTPLRIGTTIAKGHNNKTQTTQSEKLPTGPDFLVLVLDHCSLMRAQIYDRIIPYMIRHEAKRPCSSAGTEHAAYMHLNQCPPAPHKGKQPVTGSLQSRLSVHALTPAKTGLSCQRLDVDLENYNQVHEQVLPYEEAPSGEPETGDTAPPSVGANSTLHDESTMDIDSDLDDIYS
ncbi:hypothetical protein M422DRAFT_265600 [Sphaerobolus stellatus SS14]|uniref:Unplaced genomic scaffold SPHSTscaffold_150, whole genome shotgun sequence n=1 Tax=Sphaerobolus stellatus (strain SS14) TaxID=990650 RepID=A0A0C9UCY0_SPHS4|nr:hypothetical protein M422DRAFT_265600 [Sphaerobolus stellatus SS14]